MLFVIRLACFCPSSHDVTENKEEQVSQKKKEEKAKPEDPSFVPKSGRFFMHDDRAEDVNDTDSRDQKKLWSEEEDEGVWLHDKFNEQSGNSQRGRRSNYSKNNKYVKRRDNTYKDKNTSQQQYRRKTESQTNHEQPKPTSQPTESKPSKTTVPASNGEKTDYHPSTQNYQPKRTSYRAKQSYNQPSEPVNTQPSSNREGSKRYSSQRGNPISTDVTQPIQDYAPSTQQYPKQQMRPSKSYVPRSNSNNNTKPVVSTTPVAPAVPEEYNVISSATSMQYNYGYNVPQYPPGVYNPYLSNYPYQYPYPYIPSMPSVVQPTDPAILSQGSIQYYSVPYVEDPTKSKKQVTPTVNDTNGSSQNNAKSQWIPKRSHAIPIKEPPPETNAKSTQ